MRKIFFILFVFFATFCFVKNEVSSDDDEDNVRVNPLHILKGLTIDSWIIDSLSFIVLGPTGVGKSTLVNFLAGFLLKPIESSRSVNKLYVVDLEENSGEVTTKIGYEIHSQTSIPIFVPSRKDNQTFLFDTAGYSESRGFVNEVVNHYGVQQMLSLTKNVKIIIAIDELGLRTNKLKNVLAQLNLINDFSNSIGLIITKVNEKTQLKQLDDILYQKISQLSNQGVKGIQLIKSAFALGNYAIFSTPERIVATKTTLEKQRQKIFDMINSLNYTSPKKMKKFMNIQQNFIMQQKIETVKNRLIQYQLQQALLEQLSYINRQRPLEIQKVISKINAYTDLGTFNRMLQSILSEENTKVSKNYRAYRPFLQFLDSKIKSEESLVQEFNKAYYRTIMTLANVTQQQISEHQRLPKGFFGKVNKVYRKIFG